MARCGFNSLVIALTASLAACGSPSPEPVGDALLFFEQTTKTVVTFVGYSGSGYEDEDLMLASARELLADRDPDETIVNIGATSVGIGAVYEVAKSMGFETTGIVSTQARVLGAELSGFVDRVFFIDDETWGGVVDDTGRLSPTSETMVASSDVFVAIGGGDVARDEFLAAKGRGKVTVFIPADMNHAVARAKARRKGLPEPTDFTGSAHAVLLER